MSFIDWLISVESVVWLRSLLMKVGDSRFLLLVRCGIVGLLWIVDVVDVMVGF